MDGTPEQILTLFGIPLTYYAAITTITYAVVQVLKTKLGETLIYGHRTDILAVIISFSLTLAYLGIPTTGVNDWIKVAVLGLMGWLGPSAIHNTLKEASLRKGNGE